MLAFLNLLVGPVFSTASKWITGKQEASARADSIKAEESKIINTHTAEWEQLMAKNSGDSWKDEFWTIALAIPLGMAFVPSLADFARQGFEVISTLPDWYHQILMIIIPAAFGIRGIKGFANMRNQGAIKAEAIKAKVLQNNDVDNNMMASMPSKYIAEPVEEPKRSSLDVFTEEVLRNEGYYSASKTVFDLGDGAGFTHKSGITEATYSHYIGRKATKSDMEAMSYDHIKAIYKEQYWDKVHGDKLPNGVNFLVGDMAINAGPVTAKKLLQRAIGVKEDGAIGPQTMTAIHNYEGDLINTYSDVRVEYYRSLKQFGKFGRGWLNRVAHSQEIAYTLI